jgi:hypothetical protein
MRSDFESACDVLGKMGRFINKGSLKEAESYLNDKEKVLHVEVVNLKKVPGILVVTDTRIFFTLKVGTKTDFKQLPYDSLSSVSMGKGELAINTTHEKIDITSIHYKRVKEVHKSIMQYVS